MPLNKNKLDLELKDVTILFNIVYRYFLSEANVFFSLVEERLKCQVFLNSLEII